VGQQGEEFKPQNQEIPAINLTQKKIRNDHRIGGLTKKFGVQKPGKTDNEDIRVVTKRRGSLNGGFEKVWLTLRGVHKRADLMEPAWKKEPNQKRTA